MPEQIIARGMPEAEVREIAGRSEWLESVARRFWPKVEKTGGCWVWRGSLSSQGYGQLSSRHGKPPLRAHRISWELHNGSLLPGQQVLHRCDTPACVRPDHLFLGTPAINAADKVQKGRARGGSLAGEANPSAKLTREQVRAIRDDPRPSAPVAAEYGVGKTTIKYIRRGQLWPT